MKELIAMLKRHEGLMLKPYRCTAEKLTIGYGRNLEDRGITEKEAEFLLINDINDVRELLETYILYFNEKPEMTQNVLINMGFQLGVGGLLKFRKMLKAIEKKDYQVAADEMLNSNWARQTPERAKELAKIMRKEV